MVRADAFLVKLLGDPGKAQPFSFERLHTGIGNASIIGSARHAGGRAIA